MSALSEEVREAARRSAAAAPVLTDEQRELIRRALLRIPLGATGGGEGHRPGENLPTSSPHLVAPKSRVRGGQR